MSKTVKIRWEGKRGFITQYYMGKKYTLTETDEYPMEIPLPVLKEIYASRVTAADCIVPCTDLTGVDPKELEEALARLEELVCELKEAEDERDELKKEVEKLKADKKKKEKPAKKVEKNAD